MTVSASGDDVLGRIDLRSFRALGSDLESWALLSESSVSLDVLALLASSGRMNFDALRRRVLAGQAVDTVVGWAHRLARVAALMPDVDHGFEFAEALFSKNLEDLLAGQGKTDYLKLLAELRGLLGDWAGAREIVETTRLRDTYYGYLRADVVNPFITGFATEAEWLDLFNGPFVGHDLSPVTLTESGAVPFNRLAPTIADRVTEGPLVTVILTVYNPDPEDLKVAANSILSQTWQNLELLMVDDCSPVMPAGLLEEIAASDSRVRILRLPANGGTYRARNFGLLASRGEFVTGMDSDDWSHPERLARQMAVMTSDPAAIGVDTRANRTSDALQRMSLGHGQDRRCEASLLVRRSDAIAVGGYLPVRKGGDSEFRLRLERLAGRKVASLRDPLYIIRLSQGSLSRSDFRPGWSHPGRRAFFGAFTQWHEDMLGKRLLSSGLQGVDDLPFAGGPARIIGTPRASPWESVVVLGDWREPGVRQLDELITLAAHADIAILHVDAPFGRPRDLRRIHPRLQRLINSGGLRRVYVDELTDVSLLVVRDPSLVQFTRHIIEGLKVRQALLMAEPDQCGRTYDPDVVYAIARQAWGESVRWVICEGLDSATVENELRGALFPITCPIVVRPERMSSVRLGQARGRVVIGRTAVERALAWPNARVFESIYPLGGTVEVRVLGDISGAERITGWAHLPDNWVHCVRNRTDPEVFWKTVTCGLHYHRGGYPLPFDDVVHAVAAGTVIMTDQVVDSRLAPCVVSMDEQRALDAARRWSADPIRSHRWAASSQQALMRAFSPDHMKGFVTEVLAMREARCA